MNVWQYVGHYHPLLVHLPIGILLAAIVLDLLSIQKGFRSLQKAVRVLLMLGFLAAFFSSITGYLLSSGGDYEVSLLGRHQWLGIATTIVSLGALLVVSNRPRSQWVRRTMLIGLGILIMFTGHAGGSITHGEDFLVYADDVGDTDFSKIDPSTAVLYSDLVAPILDRKCKTCHGPAKQKGNLRLDQPEFISKGGKTGAVLQQQDGNSELLNRIQLNIGDKEHMPPKERRQLSAIELLIVRKWIESGGNFKAKLSSVANAGVLIDRLKNPVTETDETERVAMPAPAVIETLRKEGVVVSFVSRDNGAVSLNLSYADSAHINNVMKELPKIRVQVVELTIGRKLSDGNWQGIVSLTSLCKLNVANSNFGDTELKNIQSLPRLRYLNLVGTPISMDGLKALKPMSGIVQLYLYKTAIPAGRASELQAVFPKALIDFGNYDVPTLPDDTLEVTKPYKVN